MNRRPNTFIHRLVAETNGEAPRPATVPFVLVALATVFAASATWLLRSRRLTFSAAGAVGGVLALVLGPILLLPVLLLAVPVAAALVEIDLISLRLPDPLVGALGVILGLPLTVSGTGIARPLAAGVLVAVTYLAIALLPGRGLGLGDVKLAAVLGYALGFAGWPDVLAGVVVLPSLLMGPVAVVLLIRRRAGPRTDLPFGPALLLGALIAATAGAVGDP